MQVNPKENFLLVGSVSNYFHYQHQLKALLFAVYCKPLFIPGTFVKHINNNSDINSSESVEFLY